MSTTWTVIDFLFGGIGLAVLGGACTWLMERNETISVNLIRLAGWFIRDEEERFDYEQMALGELGSIDRPMERLIEAARFVRGGMTTGRDVRRERPRASRKAAQSRWMMKRVLEWWGTGRPSEPPEPAHRTINPAYVHSSETDGVVVLQGLTTTSVGRWRSDCEDAGITFEDVAHAKRHFAASTYGITETDASIAAIPEVLFQDRVD